MSEIFPFEISCTLFSIYFTTDLALPTLNITLYNKEQLHHIACLGSRLRT